MRKLGVGKSIKVGDVELAPIEVTYVGGGETRSTLAVVAAKEPVAIVIRSHLGVWALDVEGQRTSLDDLLNEVEGLRNWVA